MIDVDWSRDYYTGHIPGAWYGIRTRLDTFLPQLPAADALMFTPGAGVLAQLAADYAKSLTKAQAFAHDGGTAVWRPAGLPLEQGATRMATPAEDLRLRARAIRRHHQSHAGRYGLEGRNGQPDGHR